MKQLQERLLEIIMYSMKIQITLVCCLLLAIKSEAFFNRIQEAVRHVEQAVQQVPQQVVHAIVSAPAAVESAAKGVASAVEHAAKSVGDTVQEGIDGASSAIDSAAKDTGNFLQEVGDGAASAVKSVGKGTERGWDDISSKFEKNVKSLAENVINPEVAFKDAVSTINEGIDFLSHYIKILEKEIDFVFDEDCYYNCENKEAALYPNLSYSPELKGFGARGFSLPPFVLPNPSMNLCCIQHAKCFGTCGSNKGKCDKEFLLCLYATCGADLSLLCHGTATLLYTASRTLNCEHFKEIQSKACKCMKECV